MSRQTGLLRVPAPAGRAGKRIAATTRRGLATGALASSMVVSFLAASAAPTPLYDRYVSMWHGSALIGTIAFAIYAVAVLVGLLWLGELAGYLGRRPLLLAALAGQIVALVLFTFAGSFAPILIGRAVQGLAAGAALGALSATMIEADADRGTVAGAASPAAGSGLGAILSGLVVSLLPGPTHTIYLILIAVMALQAVGVASLFASAARRPVPISALQPRIAVPPAARTAFLAGAPLVFAAWALGGFDAALSPALYDAITHGHSVWRSALPLTLLAGTACVAVILLRAASARALTLVGAASLIVGLGLTVTAIAIGSGALLLLASAVAGIGFGAGFQGPLRAVAGLSTPPQRPGALSAVFVVAYVGFAVPAVVAGALVSSGASLTGVATTLAIVLAILTAGALAASTRRAA